MYPPTQTGYLECTLHLQCSNSHGIIQTAGYTVSTLLHFFHFTQWIPKEVLLQCTLYIYCVKSTVYRQSTLQSLYSLCGGCTATILPEYRTYSPVRSGWWPWNLTFDLDHQIHLRFHQGKSQCQISWAYVNLTNWHTDTQIALFL